LKLNNIITVVHIGHTAFESGLKSAISGWDWC